MAATLRETRNHLMYATERSVSVGKTEWAAVACIEAHFLYNILEAY